MWPTVAIGFGCLSVGFLLGWHYNSLNRKVSDLVAKVKDLELTKKNKVEIPPHPVGSYIIDPDDVVANARREQERLMRELNGEK